MDYNKLANQLKQRFLNDISGNYQMHSDICRDCNKAATAITDLLARAEAAEARCETLEKMVKEYQETIIPGFREAAEKAERERDAALQQLELKLKEQTAGTGEK